MSVRRWKYAARLRQGEKKWEIVCRYVVDEKKNLHTTSEKSSTVRYHARNFKVMWFSHRVGGPFLASEPTVHCFFFFSFFFLELDRHSRHDALPGPHAGPGVRLRSAVAPIVCVVTVDRDILGCALGWLGVPAWFRRVCFLFPSGSSCPLQACYWAWSCLDCGSIPQGCPSVWSLLSPFMLLGATTWRVSNRSPLS